MKYYKIDYEENPDGGGPISKLGIFKHAYDYNKPNSMSNLVSYEKNNFTPDFENCLIDEGYELRDLIQPINMMASGLFISDKARKVIENLKLQDHEFYPATVLYDGNILKYWWLNLYTFNKEYYDWIDWEKSEFRFKNMTSKEVIEVKINSKYEYEAILKKYSDKYKNGKLFLWYMPTTVLKVVKDFKSGYDLFKFPLLKTKLISSKRFKTEIENNNLNGFMFDCINF